MDQGVPLEGLEPDDLLDDGENLRFGRRRVTWTC
jgi:hypothetical protein